MLDILRKKGVSKRIIWVIVIIIIISFGFLGTAYLVTGSNQEQYAGKIFGRKISLDTYNKAYQDATIQAIIRYGDKFNSIRQFLNLESETWDRLILLNEANKRNIKVSDAEVVKAVEEYPFFQRDGQFDSLLYKDIIRYVFKMDPRQFEENVRETQRLNKLVELTTAEIKLTDEDIFKAFQEANSKVQISYILVSPDKFKKEVTSTEAEEKSYYENHKNEYLLPATFKAEYVTFEFALTPDQKEEDIAKIKETVMAKAQEFYQKVQTQKDLTAAAKENNLEVKTTDYFSPQEPNNTLGWPMSVYREILSLNVSDMTQPLDTGRGITIIKVIDKKESFVPEFAQVQDKVKDGVLLEKAKSIAKVKAQELLTQVKDAISKTSFVEFSKIAKNLGADIDQTPAFARGQYLPKIGIEPGFQDTAFSLNEQNKLSDLVETQIGWTILYLDQIIPAEKEEFEKQKQEFADKYFSEKKMSYFSDFLTGLRVKANLEDNISKLKEANKI